MTTVKKKIIIADDDPGIQDILRIIFEKAGYITTIFSNGLNILKNNYERPDIFLLDRQLSGSDGLEICRYLKSRPETKFIPVIMISATPGIKELAKEAGADDFLEKPFVMTHLLNKISAALDRVALASALKKAIKNSLKLK
jgi:DNA-binding response OmpR family regulator